MKARTIIESKGLRLETVVNDFAMAFQKADAKQPSATNVRSGIAFQPGLGPHTEAKTVELVMLEAEKMYPERYAGRVSLGVSYPNASRRRCDLCLGKSPSWEWVIEVKMLRFFGDNGKLNDNILMHVLSPYTEHRSALTDCEKLVQSELLGKKAVLIYGFDHREWPLDPAIDAFELLAGSRVELGDRYTASFQDLVHPIHNKGRVFAWEVQRRTTSEL